jgi:cytochrome d ubiquinol oxidase subunit I
MNVEILSRLQFAFAITFHYIYPPLSMGLSLALVLIGIQLVRTNDKKYKQMLSFWLRVFALTFALGVATGLPMEFSLGTNWARYSRFVGDVFGGILGPEGIFAFLVEAGFLGVMLFGFDRVGPRMHLLSSIFVCLGAHFSGVWIVVANSWMHTPAAYTLVKGADGVVTAQSTSWLGVIFNPSSVPQTIHVILSTWMSGAFLMLSVAAYYMLKKRHKEFARLSFKMGLWIATIATGLQLIAADSLGKVVGKYNPVKLAAFEGVWDTQEYTPAFAMGWVDVKNEKTYGIGIPGLLSFLVHTDFKEPVPGLKQFPKNEWPGQIQAVFQLYHLMIMLWGVMAMTCMLAWWAWRRGLVKHPEKHPWILRLLVISVAFPQIASISGWYSACMGRQPWVVHGLLRTKDAFSQTVSLMENALSLAMFVIVYTGFFVLFLMLLDKKIKQGPSLEEEDQPEFRNRYSEG